jgi:hypothetical protein
MSYAHITYNCAYNIALYTYIHVCMYVCALTLEAAALTVFMVWPLACQGQRG